MSRLKQHMGDQMRALAQHALAWLTQEKHKAQLQRVQSVFTTHPEETGETYLVHFWFTFRMGLRFAFVSIIIMLHGIFPFLFTRTASLQIEQVYRTMKARIPKKRREEIDREKLYSRKRHDNITGDARIAIVGGGFSGLAVLANLVRRASRPMTIEWFDAGTAFVEGVAYSTKCNAHLLNVPANSMGIFSKQKEGFYQWLKTTKGSTRAARIWPQRTFDGESYVPRMLFAAYLQSVLEDTLEEAKRKGILVNMTRAAVADAKLYNTDAQQIMLTIKNDDAENDMLVDALVLATGNLPPRKFAFQSGIINAEADYVPNVWKVAGSPEFAGRVKSLPAGAEIVIIGSGLTMVDMILTLSVCGYKGKVTAISRSGVLPAVHVQCKEYPKWAWVNDPRLAPKTAYGLLHGLREQVKHAKSKGYDWRAVVDSLRPVTQTLWRRLSINEKRRFLTRLYTVWNIHRHRMAPEVHEVLLAMQQSGRLRVVSGSIYYVGSDKEGLALSYRKRKTNKVETLRPALVLNCTGPENDIANSDHELLKHLRDKELITVGPLRVGIEVSSNGAAKGNAPDTLFPVGPLLAGEYLECTAVPELREVASETADYVLARVEMIAHHDVRDGLSLGEAI